MVSADPREGQNQAGLGLGLDQHGGMGTRAGPDCSLLSLSLPSAGKTLNVISSLLKSFFRSYLSLFSPW